MKYNHIADIVSTAMHVSQLSSINIYNFVDYMYYTLFTVDHTDYKYIPISANF